MNILKTKNIKTLLITLIVIFGLIFIIVGERPRHKAGVKNYPKPNTQDSKTITSNEDKQPAVVPSIKTIPTQKPEKLTNDNIIAKSDGKKNVENKHNSDNSSYMEQAIEAKSNKIDSDIETLEEKKNLDVNISEAGLNSTANTLEPTSKEISAIQKEEDKDSQPVKSLTKLSDPKLDEPATTNPAITKEQALQDKYPQRYETMTVLGTDIVYAIDTSTAELSVLLSGNTFWINLGKPQDAVANKLLTYTLEGTTKESAVVLDTTTAQAWRVKISDDDIEWSIIKPFSDNNK